MSSTKVTHTDTEIGNEGPDVVEKSAIKAFFKQVGIYLLTTMKVAVLSLSVCAMIFAASAAWTLGASWVLTAGASSILLVMGTAFGALA